MGLVSGRITGLAVAGSDIYIGGANGGVFRSSDGGQTWTPMTDGLPTLSVGDLRVAPTARCGSRPAKGTPARARYVGSGVYRLANPTTACVHGSRPSRRHRARKHVHRQSCVRRRRQRVRGDVARLVEACGARRGRRMDARAVSGARSGRERRAAARSAVALQQHLQRRRDPAGQRRPARARQLRLARRRGLQRLLLLDRRRRDVRARQSERRRSTRRTSAARSSPTPSTARCSTRWSSR